MYDVVIVGAGPAGANLARLIGDQYKVLLLDKRDFDQENPANLTTKCCGGLLAPDAQKIIAKLNLGVPKDTLVDPQLFAVRTIDLTNHLERLYQRFYFNMDREKFDRWLVSLVPSSVEKKFNSFFTSCVRIPQGYEIKYRHKGQEISAKTRILVGADGATSKVRRYLCNDIPTPEKFIAIQEWFQCSSPMPYFTAIFDEEISDFYSWIIPKENYLLLGAALRPKENAQEKFELLKAKLSQLDFPLEHSIKTEGAIINRPKKLSQFHAGSDGIVLIGEAAGAISPSSAEGISYALKSSLYLAESLKPGMDGFLARYKKKVNNIKINLWMKNLKSPAMFHPTLRKIAMKSGLQSIR